MDNISIETYKLIAEAGIRLGQANPDKDVNELVKILVKMQIEFYLNR